MTIQKTIDTLKAGNKTFVTEFLNGQLTENALNKDLLNGQDPYAIVLSCADSRVVPEYIFNASLGDLFVIRVAGNIPNKSSVASIEYAVLKLNAKVIVVLGHQNCKAVTAAVAGNSFGSNLDYLLNYISPAIVASKKNASINDVIKKNAELSATELINNSAIIKDAVDKKKVKIISAYYNLDTGKVDFLNS